jgi:flagellar biogenesis protein FliO
MIKAEHNFPQQAARCAVGHANRADQERRHLDRFTAGLLAFVVLGVFGAQRLPAQTPQVPAGAQHNDSRDAPRQAPDSSSRTRANSAVPQRLPNSRPITRTGRHLSPASKSSQKSSSGSGSPWKTFGALAFVLALIFVGAKLWKKHGPGIAAGLPAEAIDVLGKRHLNSRQSIHLIRLGSRILVLGSSAEGLRTLAEVTDPVEVDYLAGLCQQRSSAGSAAQSFRALFNRHSSARQKHDADALLNRTPENEFSITGSTHDTAVAHTGLVSGEAPV